MEPERRIEKWLHAFAKKRREQAGDPMELRASTRQRLQREIARQSEEKSRGGFFSNLFFGPRLRLAFAACFTALAIGGWFVWRESTGSQPAALSMNKLDYPEMTPGSAAPETPPPAVMSPAVASADKKVEKQKAAPTAPPQAQPTVASANRTLAAPPSVTLKERDRAESTAAQKQLTVTTAAASAPATNTLLAFKNETSADSLAGAGALAKDAESTLPSVAVPSASNFIAGTIPSNAIAGTPPTFALQKALTTRDYSNSTALFDAAKVNGAVTVSQIFNRLVTSSTQRRAAGTRTTPPPVLASFRVEQNGNNLKVVDTDGSVYTGSVQIAQQEPAADYSFAAAKNAPAGSAQATKAPASSSQNYFFRVAGTNRNLNQNVVFSGNFVPLTNYQLTAGAGFGGGGGGAGGVSNPAAGQPIQTVLSTSEINGNVVIGDQKAIDVLATPAR